MPDFIRQFGASGTSSNPARAGQAKCWRNGYSPTADQICLIFISPGALCDLHGHFANTRAVMRHFKKDNVKTLTYIWTLIILVALSSCDPVHTLTLENKAKSKIEIIYYPTLDNRQIGNKTPETIDLRGQKIYKITLDSAETIAIGTVVAMYAPSANDIDLDYLEIRYGQDTLRLTGKNAILTTIQKVEKLDWRLIVK